MMQPWHEDDELWETLGPLTMFASQMNGRVEDEASLISRLLPPAASVLDLGCGPGRHCLALAQQGFRVTGVDRCRSLLDEAERRADAEGVMVEYVQADMRSFRRQATFDAVVNLSTSFGFFEDIEEDRAVVRNAHRSLRKGGILIMDMVGKEVLARRFTSRTWSERGDLFLLLERRVSGGWTWVTDRWVIVQGGERREFVMSYRPYSAAELKAVLSSCGFDSVEIWGDLSGADYDERAERLVAMALA